MSTTAVIDDSSIAIIGMSCRVSKAQNYHELWDLLSSGSDASIELSDSELRESGIPDEIFASPQYVKKRPYLPKADYFDNNFFDINFADACLIDPQQKVFLEEVWSALEDAGYNPFETKEIIGLYAGCSFNSYFLAIREMLDNNFINQFQAMIANDKDYLTTRVAYKLNLKGPAVTVQSACSTSLVAVHQACQSLLNGECTISIAGGVSILYPYKQGYEYQSDMILSSDGFCRAFDSKAQGTTIGDGSGVVILKLLSDAIKDNDHIHGIINSSAINNDGAQKAAFTAPNPDKQSAVIEQAIRMAGISPDQMSYIEAHGTGTKLGDLIEIRALSKVFSKYTNRKNFCKIGSIKTNIGHLNAASGIVGLIKTVLCLKHRQFVKNIHFISASKELNIEQSAFMIPTENESYTSESTFYAGVSSFGFGGTNAHVVLSENRHHKLEASNADRKQNSYLFVLSSKTNLSLLNLAKKYIQFLKQTKVDIEDLCYMLTMRRAHFDVRIAYVVSSQEEILKKLNIFIEKENISNHPPMKKIFKLFLGDMVDITSNEILTLLNTYKIFTKSIENFNEILKRKLKCSVLDLMSQNIAIDFEVKKKLICFISIYSFGNHAIEHYEMPQAITGQGAGLLAVICLLGLITPEHAIDFILSRKLKIDHIVRGINRENLSYYSLAKKCEFHPDECSLDLFNADLSGNTYNASKNEDFYNLFVNNHLGLMKYIQHYIADLYVNKKLINFNSYYLSSDKYRKLSLPTYCFSSVQCSLKEKNESSDDLYISKLVPCSPVNKGLKLDDLLIVNCGFCDDSLAQEWINFYQKKPALDDETQLFTNSKLVNMKEYKEQYENNLRQKSRVLFLYFPPELNSTKLTFDAIFFDICDTIRLVNSCTRSSKLILLTSSIFNSVEDTEVTFLNMLVASFSKLLASEFNNIFGGIVNIDKTILKRNLGRTIFNGICYLKERAKILHFSEEGVFKQKLVKYNFDGDIEINNNFCKDGICLITGATGGIANLLLDKIFDSGARTFLLLGHRELDSKQGDYLTLKKKKLGINIIYIKTDLSDYSRLESDIENNVSISSIKSIYHLAGSSTSSSFLSETNKNMLLQASPKILGTWNLYKFVKKIDLEHFVIFSSAVTHTGSYGQASYLIANEFANLFSSFSYSLNKSVVVIQWGPWAEVGMYAKQSDSTKNKILNFGFKEIHHEKAFEITDQVLSHNLGSIAFFPFDWKKSSNLMSGNLFFIDYLEDFLEVDTQDIANTGKSLLVESIINATGTQNIEIIKCQLRKLLSIYKSENTEINDFESFTEIGLDSFSAIELVNKIEQAFCFKINIATLFNYPTLDKLSDYVLSKIIADKNLLNSEGQMPDVVSANDVEKIIEFIELEYSETVQ